MIMGYLRVTLSAHGNSSYALISGEECLVDRGEVHFGLSPLIRAPRSLKWRSLQIRP